MGDVQLVDPFDISLIDGRHLLYRAAGVFADLTAPLPDGDEQPTGAIYGFLRILLSYWAKFGGMVFIAWDTARGPSERRRTYPDYKRQRDELSPEIKADIQRMRGQEATLQELLTTLGIRQAWADGWEADDVIAALVARFGGSYRIAILSGDRDLLQLVNGQVALIRPQPKGQFKVESEATVREAFGVSPSQILDLKALAGDASDNIPGAPGIGLKTASKLIIEHGAWQRALEWALANEPQARWHRSLAENADKVRISAKLAALNAEAPLTFAEAKADGKKAFIEMARLHFNSLLPRRADFMKMGTG